MFLRDEFGAPLSVTPQLTLHDSTGGGGFSLVEAHQVGDAWVFSGLQTAAEYELDIRAEGYQPDHEEVTLPPIEGAQQHVVVFLNPIGQKKAPPGGMILAPRAQKEVENGLKDLRARKFESAEKHLNKALSIAPASPFVNYAAGMAYFLWGKLPQAEQYLAKSVSIDPREPAALLALGAVRFQLNENAGAIEVLQQDVQLDAKSWKGQWMLANAYLRQGSYAQARASAERAMAMGKADAAPAELILADALAGLGEREKAIATFQGYLNTHPQDGRAAQIRAFITQLEKPPQTVVPVAAAAASGPSNVAHPAALPLPADIGVPPPPVELPPNENWAPPDVDAAKPFVVSGASCSLPKVMESAAKYASTLVTTLGNFTATEQYQTVEVKRDERLETPETRTYNYMAVVDKSNPHLIEMDEIRDSRSHAEDTPGLLVDKGTPVLALAFHPLFSGSFDFSCEGLGEWKGKSAWVVHFRQRTDKPTGFLQAFEAVSGEYLLPLKGRAWVAENGGEVMHLDTDLTHAVKQVGLLREHFSIDYAPVLFPTHKQVLWLPQDADVYYQYQGHYIHHYHHFSDFKMFWVGTSEKDEKPTMPKDSKPSTTPKANSQQN
ncbi:MAG TPA: tetratricopeptide repeat protein [Candidatus Acidoferrales bacterium]|nr:tetratricopeptide repeat protein [Candidatus Acidoferrales bacterium]